MQQLYFLYIHIKGEGAYVVPLSIELCGVRDTEWKNTPLRREAVVAITTIRYNSSKQMEYKYNI